MKTDARGLPVKAEFRGSQSLVIVQILTPPDADRRQMIRACWLSDKPWVPDGVQAKVHTVVPSRWIRDQRSAGKTVKVVGGEVEE